VWGGKSGKRKSRKSSQSRKEENIHMICMYIYKCTKRIRLHKLKGGGEGGEEWYRERVTEEKRAHTRAISIYDEHIYT